MSLQESLSKLNEIDINDIDFENIGTWSLGGRIFVWLLLAVIVAGVGYWFVIQPQIDQLEQSKAQEVEKRRQFESMAAQASSIDVYRAQLVEIEQSFSALLSQLPSETEVPGLLDDISETGINSGLSFKTIQLRPEQVREYYIELPIQITVSGGYHDMGTFVSGVAGLSRIVTLHNFDISGSNPDDLQMEITASTYRYKGGDE
ncbi:type 4a pilus biogenesis protein PilO [uncultured Umboniibacter sp.]|uniref:type 4a pilus biogenesis protein PilO n=1 Tax=uncultured Umboniibacter sp. TaxID=1798917 RepID=UPI002607A197|nr:type 4a pilus biogenesis protein PilO [uncultured Umboniibacter sp.]